MPMLLFPITVFVLGAIIGSFLNVVIYRYPREESVVFPASHCPNCHTNIKPYDNVPILAWLWLRGRCRTCHEPIDIRYPLVELANAAFYLAIFLRTGIAPIFIPLAAFISMTIVLIYIDADIQILPDVITYPGIVVGILAALAGGALVTDELLLASDWIDSLIGACVGALIITTIIAVYWLVRRVQGMGWGDVKMMAMIGALLGWEATLGVLLVGSILGTIVGVPIALRSAERMQYALPFGVFLGIATLVILFFGPTLLGLWMPLFLVR